MQHSSTTNRTWRWQQPIVDLAKSEDGGAYTLSYVMVIPILMLLICLIVETTLMMCAKVGTVHAAYSGARAASVWSSATNSWSESETRIQQAAIQSFVPYASGISLGSSGDTEADVDAYVRAYKDFADKPVSDKYIRSKYKNAASLLKVTVDAPARWDSDLTVNVAYKFPFNVPGIGRLIGESGAGGHYYFRLESEVTLRNDGPQNKDQDLGIGYGRFE
jgi:Flp pilus assembly protein TadG